MPQITMEDLQNVEKVVRTDPKVIEQCVLSGIAPEDMHKVYCDPWTIGYDHRFGNKIRLQQALMYYRPHIDDSQYSFPLDLCPIFNADTQKIIDIDPSRGADRYQKPSQTTTTSQLWRRKEAIGRISSQSILLSQKV